MNDIERRKLQADIDRFIADGGQIKHYPFGIVAKRDDGKTKTQAEIVAEIREREWLLKQERSA